MRVRSSLDQAAVVAARSPCECVEDGWAGDRPTTFGPGDVTPSWHRPDQLRAQLADLGRSALEDQPPTWPVPPSVRGSPRGIRGRDPAPMRRARHGVWRRLRGLSERSFGGPPFFEDRGGISIIVSQHRTVLQCNTTRGQGPWSVDSCTTVERSQGIGCVIFARDPDAVPRTEAGPEGPHLAHDGGRY